MEVTMKLSRSFAAIIIATSLFLLNSTVPAELVPLKESITSNKLTTDNINVSESTLDSTINANISTNSATSDNTAVNNQSSSATPVSQNNTNSKQISSVQPPSSSAKQPDAASTPPPSPQPQKPVAEAPKPAPIVETPKPAPPSNPSSDKLILGYGTYYSSKDVSSLNSLKAHSSLIDELATHTYIVDTTGGLYIQGNVFPTSQVSFANSNGIKTLAVVRNEFNGELAHDILSSPTSTNNLINNIEKSLAANNYKGVNIDFELLYSKDREAFTNFMRDLYSRLHPKGYIVSIALPAKTSESEKWVYAYDYAKLGSYSDQVILMTYDEHYPGGAPGPVASLSWTQRVVNYAASVIPKSKLLLGVAAYGYDWTVKDGKTISTKSLGISSAYSTASANGAQILWDNIAQVPYYNYTDSKGSHSVYFENGTSISYKLNIVNNSNLKGIAIWRLGLEDESYWTTIKTKIR
jgi:spore germination protein YaaH